ncbi:MAG: glycosyltransferase family 4 protein [Myxococcales bacterium]|nr:glycosyltransferase family 4 protein [Myxococcales bacterium]
MPSQVVPWRASFHPGRTQFHILSFEGPDPYATVGGLGTRVSGLTEALATLGHQTHLWFVGDPDRLGHEQRGDLCLHRWCQWISDHHRGGVYEGEHGKAVDYATSLPPFMLHRALLPHLLAGGYAVVIAEEWQTVNALLHLDWLLREAGLRDRVSLNWNANNTYGFQQIDWQRLRRAATITTVSRYMNVMMRPFGVSPVVIPNGLGSDAFLPPEPDGVTRVRRNLAGRLAITKMARFDPDKRWMESIELVARLKQTGFKPILVARGGSETHGAQVMTHARRLGLRVARRENAGGDIRGLLEASRNLDDVDVLELTSHVDANCRRVLFRSSDVVLANSVHEPFGLVGLEAMAVGSIAVTGCTGEDYAIPGHNALVLQTGDPEEFLKLYSPLHSNDQVRRALCKAGRATAERYSWPSVIETSLVPHLAVG